MNTFAAPLHRSWCVIERGIAALQPAGALAARLYIAQVFWLAGLTKIRDWETTLLLFTEEYRVPLLPPAWAAVSGTAGELLLPVLLVLGLGGRLAALGLQLGADVPVFVRGENAWAEGVGERLTPLALPPATYLLADPGVHVPTAALFASQDLTRDAAPAKISDFVSGSLLGNAFEPVVRRREPAIEAVFQALSHIGTPRLTGSGGGCFVEFADRTAAEAALALLPAGLRAWVVEGAARSPLLDALAQFRGTEKNA